MNNIRFSIGVPGAGSAARIAEDAAGSSLQSRLPRAGSAARNAEERKQSEGITMRRSAAISMRATGGRVPEQAAGTSSSDLSSEERNVVTQRSQAGITFPSSSVSNLNASAPASFHNGGTGTQDSSPLPQPSAAVRLKSLVKSLFSPGDSPNKS